MGQHSTCFYNNNDELTTSLIHKKFIRTKGVEIAFRSVDRGLYFSDEKKHIAYGYISNKLYLSAPSIYAQALECLKLHPGHKFLNIGSGIGYFNTLAGVILGRNGVNHGIDTCSTLINYAYKKLEEFKLSAAAIDHYEFCEPVFIHGNAFDLLPTGYYDRVYCGAGVPREEWDLVKSLIKIGGILVMLFERHLVRVIRIAENAYIPITVVAATYHNLHMPENCSFNTVNFPSVEPLSLKELCRLNIRSILRENLKQEFPNLAMRTKCQITSIPDIIDDEDKGISELADIVRVINENTQLGSPQYLLAGLGHLNDDPSDTAVVTDEAEDQLEPSVEVPDGNSIDARVEREEIQLRTNDANTTNEETSDESTKRKTLEAGCSKQHETSIDIENLKRMKIDTPPQKTDSVLSTTSHSDYWGQTATIECPVKDHLESSVEVSDGNNIDARVERDEVQLGTNDANTENEQTSNESSIISDGSYESAELDKFGNIVHGVRFFKSFIRPSGDEKNNEEFKDMYNFHSKRNENELSQQLRTKINLLPLPPLLKAFLNYDRTD